MGHPLGVADGCMGWGGYGGGGCPMHVCMHMHMHACMHAHTHTCMLNMLNMDASMSVAICNFYTCTPVSACAYMCVCACMWGHPHAPRHPPPTCPLPRATGIPKHQNSISPELIEIILFCLKILYL